MKVISLLCEMNKTVNCDSQDLVILAVTALGELRYAAFQYPRLRGKGLCHDTVEQSCARGRCVKCSEAAHRQHSGSSSVWHIIFYTSRLSPNTNIIISPSIIYFLAYHVTQTGLEFPKYLKMTLNSQSSRLHLLNAKSSPPCSVCLGLWMEPRISCMLGKHSSN